MSPTTLTTLSDDRLYEGGVATIQKLDPTQRSKMLVGPAMDPVVLEQYRRLGAVLHHSQAQTGLRSFMVASAVPSEGKTLTAANIALTLSESFQRRVMLVDADLRRPTVHDVFRVPNVTGLNDGLKAVGPWKAPLIEVSERLSVLTAGRPNPDPISGLTSERLQQLLQDLGERYDWVIVDTPPVGLMPDAHLLAGMVGGAVLVIAAGRAPYKVVLRACEALGQERILGVVLNRAHISRGDESYGYAAYDYYKK
jgi:capsular exopolysaccharide synthesis family protein